MTEQDKIEIRAAGALAIDILQNQLHLPLTDGKINVEQIEDQIVIGLYSGELQPVTEEIVDLAISSVQDMVDLQIKAMGENWNGGDEA